MKAYPLFIHSKYEQPNPKTGKLKPVNVTTCLLLDENKKVLSAGFSCQNVIDGENRKIGNKLAKKRAISSLFLKRNIYPVRKVEAMELVGTKYKGIYNPEENVFDDVKFLINKKKLEKADFITIEEKEHE